MNYSLKQIRDALKCFDVGEEQIGLALTALNDLLDVLDSVEVKGRKNIDTLLGCMLVIEAIIGKEDSNG